MKCKIIIIFIISVFFLGNWFPTIFLRWFWATLLLFFYSSKYDQQQEKPENVDSIIERPTINPNEPGTVAVSDPESSLNQRHETSNAEMEILPNENIESDESEEFLSDEEMCAYEKLRMRNIAKRQKKFQQL